MGCVIPGSHLHHSTLVAQQPDTVDYFEVPAHSALLQLPRKLVVCRKGDLVLWDSRCVHCNMPSLLPPQSGPRELLRALVYICMTPKHFASDECLQKRRDQYERK